MIKSLAFSELAEGSQFIFGNDNFVKRRGSTKIPGVPAYREMVDYNALDSKGNFWEFDMTDEVIFIEREEVCEKS